MPPTGTKAAASSRTSRASRLIRHVPRHVWVGGPARSSSSSSAPERMNVETCHERLRTPKLELFDDGPCHLFCGGFSPHVRGRGFPLAQNLAQGPVNVCADLRQADKL